MPGWDRLAAYRASARNRARNDSSPARPVGSSFTAPARVSSTSPSRRPRFGRLAGSGPRAGNRSRLFPLGGQVGLDDLDSDGGGRGCPVPSALNYDADGDLRVVVGRVAGEDGVVETGVVHPVLRGTG